MMIKKTISTSSFIFKYFIASVVSIIAPLVVLVFAYIVLFLIAVFTNSNLGSPIALPLWAVFIIVISTIYTAALLFPSVFIAEVISRLLGKWQHIAQIPISTIILALLIYIASLAARLLPHYSETMILHWAENPLAVFLVLTIPLGIYWWTMKIIQTGISIPIKLLNRFRSLGNSSKGE